MKTDLFAHLSKGAKNYRFDLNDPRDISLPLHPEGPRAWYAEKMRFDPVMNEFFTGSVALGGSVNFRDVFFNPHAHGTHTETMGHIREEIYSINKELKTSFFLAKLISLKPEIYSGQEDEHRKTGDKIITRSQIENCLSDNDADALIVRTLPNDSSKKSQNYSNTNPTYFEASALGLMRKKGIKHLLTDLPSVDREEDGGQLLAHHSFWSEKHQNSKECTITELIFVNDEILDGTYLLNIQIAPFENDASPSKPILFKPV